MIANYRKCGRCHSHYLEVGFLAHRLAGYCTMECLIGEPRGVPTVESIAWKDGIAVTAKRKQLRSLLADDKPPRAWKFDMVHYPPPIGWQIENWRLDMEQ